MRISLCVYMILAVFFAFVLASWRTFGAIGIGPACGVVAIVWYILSHAKAPSLEPINRQRLTVIELLTILAICFVLGGLALPPVQYGPHHRRPIPATPGQPPAIQKSDAVTIDSG